MEFPIKNATIIYSIKIILLIIIIIFSGFTIYKIKSNSYKSCQTFAQNILVQGNSMSELFVPNQQVTATMNYYQCHEVQRGDIVLVKKENENQILIKYVALIPGDHFYIQGFQNGFHLIVNNNILLTPKGRPYLFNKSSERVWSYFQKNNSEIVGPKEYFVLGTNSDGSLDSSHFGPVSKEELIGRVLNFN